MNEDIGTKCPAIIRRPHTGWIAAAFVAGCASVAIAQPTQTPADLNLATLSVKGPLTLQGAVPASCSPWPVGQGRAGQTPPCPSQLNPTAPRWIRDDGFSAKDGNPSATFPKILLENSIVNFQASISYADDTTVLAIPRWDPKSAVACQSDPDCPSHSCGAPVGPLHGKTCAQVQRLVTFIPGMIEGNHAHYLLQVQKWDHDATTCQAPLPSQNPDYLPVRFDAPSPTGSSASTGGGAKGCWVTLSSGSADLFGSSAGPTSPTVAAQNGSVASRISVPINLDKVSTYLRYVVTVTEGDTRVPGSSDLSGWAPGKSTDISKCNSDLAAPYLGAVCPISASDDRIYFPFSIGGDFFDWVIHHPVAQSFFSYSTAFNPFEIVVMPTALAQLKVLPYTLVYQPPGNASKATFSTTTSFGLRIVADSKLGSNQTISVDNKGAETIGASQTNSGFGNYLGVSIGQSYSGSTSWDKNTTIGTGNIRDIALDQNTNYQITRSWQVSNASLKPGSQGDYAKAPFWSDTFILLIHPQIGFWKLGGVPVISMLAAAGTPASPDFFAATVRALDLCAQLASPYANGMQIPGTADVLSKDDCVQLLKLDPFYGVGQALPSLSNNPRFTRVGGTDYGIDPETEADLNPTLNQVVAYSSTVTSSDTGSYLAGVTDVLGSSGAVTNDFKLFGFSGSDRLDSSETLTKSTFWNVTLQSSFSATAQSSTSIIGSLDDHHGLPGSERLPYRPHVEVFQDQVFGSFLFQDPAAPAAPQPVTPTDVPR